ncbi:hypothetical protein KTO58_23935 [Chitinophaga pendula]|uniref:hypothetical protein n=1 Tax=Chitinophaga TaxID=79328 RepID=UPI0012FE67BA|nr:MULTISPECIES: hypothetical protein [Chitinophaga]UCJ06684.1 hypothetical protein KTO58_23935 [Chitinophaga pendula]
MLLLAGMHALILLLICWFITLPLGWMVWGTIGFLLINLAGVKWSCALLSKWSMQMNGLGYTFLPVVAMGCSLLGSAFLYRYLLSAPGQFLWAICLYIILAGGTCAFLIYQRKQ